MKDYQKYINALRKCAKEHENDRTSFGHIIVSDLCRDTANLLESLEQESTDKENLVVGDCISRQAVDRLAMRYLREPTDKHVAFYEEFIELPPVTPKPKTGHWILKPSNKEQGERDFIWWKCSECGQVIYSETEQDRREYHAYCSRCGAKMLPTGSEKE